MEAPLHDVLLLELHFRRLCIEWLLLFLLLFAFCSQSSSAAPEAIVDNNDEVWEGCDSRLLTTSSSSSLLQENNWLTRDRTVSIREDREEVWVSVMVGGSKCMELFLCFVCLLQVHQLSY
jgi:hypothetical protein